MELGEKELSHLRDTIQKGVSNEKDLVWIMAFKVYNQNNRPLSMGCRPCYSKVFQYINTINNGHKVNRTQL